MYLMVATRFFSSSKISSNVAWSSRCATMLIVSSDASAKKMESQVCTSVLEIKRFINVVLIFPNSVLQSLAKFEFSADNYLSNACPIAAQKFSSRNGIPIVKA